MAKKSKVKIVVGGIVLNEELFLPLNLKSYIDWVDRVVIVDGGSTDGTLDIIKRFQKQYPKKIVLLHNKWDQDYRGMFGRQYNVWLDYLKKNCLGWWAINVDFDEVLGDRASELQDFLSEDHGDKDVFDVRTEHFYWNLRCADNTRQKHFTRCRIFKIREILEYPEVEHSTLGPDTKERRRTIDTPFLFHYGGLKGIGSEWKKLQIQKKKSNIHSKEALVRWQMWHLAGELPVRDFPLDGHPKAIKDFFLEVAPVNHRVPIMEHFERTINPIPKEKRGKLVDVGCSGAHNREDFEKLGFDWSGVDKLKFKDVIQADMSNMHMFKVNTFDVVFCSHTFEHCFRPVEALAEFWRICKPDGLIYIAWPIYHEKMIKEGDSDHILVFTEMQMKKMLKLFPDYRLIEYTNVGEEYQVTAKSQIVVCKKRVRKDE